MYVTAPWSTVYALDARTGRGGDRPGSAEYGVRGVLAGYDVRTGQRRWRFYTVPGNPAIGPDNEVLDAPLRDIAAPTQGGGGVPAGVLPDVRSSPCLQSAALFRLPPLEAGIATAQYAQL